MHSFLFRLGSICVCMLSLLAMARERRISAIVVFTTERQGADEWLIQPGLAFIEAYVMFPPEIADSVVFGISQEFFEGKNDPIYFPGGDWMALIGLRRTGTVMVSIGSPEMLAGTPTEDEPGEEFSLDVALQPNTWYRLHCIADFGDRKHVSFSIEGPDIQKTFDLNAHSLNYPHVMPFDDRSLTDYVWSANLAALGGDAQDCARVYFDDVRYGLVRREIGPDGKERLTEMPVAFCDFEAEKGTIEEMPISMKEIMHTNIIPLGNYVEGKWYLEREEVLSRAVKVPFARSGQTVIECDTTLEDISYKDWLRRRTTEESDTKP